jgi:DNA repair photolyase
MPPSDDALPALPRKGRGAVSNRPSARFGLADRYAVDDGWGAAEEEEWAPREAASLGIDAARRIITSNDSPDIGFSRSINPYRGCEHGCIYCFARPTHAFLNLSPGLDFETRIFHKPDAPALLRRELSAPGYVPKPVMLGINTDAYQPFDRREGLTRRILQVLAEFRHPVGLLTKSALIERDIDILAPMAAAGLARAGISITTLDRELARRMEPRATTPGRRLAAIRALAAAGIPVTVMAAPVIPGLTCHEIEPILEAAAEAGATGAGMTLVRLPHEIRPLFEEWLHAHAPDRAGRVLSLIRQCRGGKLNQAAFGERMRGTGPYAELLRQRFALAAARLGLDRPRLPLDTSRFRAAGPQLSLF